jgi:phospholipase C
MNRTLRAWISVGAASLLMTACGGGGTGSSSLPTSPASSQRPGSGRYVIKHIVLMIQENRTFNDLFAGFPGAVSSKTGMELVKNGNAYTEQSIALRQTGLLDEGNLSHLYAAFQTGYQNGNMDGFNLITYGSNGRPEGTAPYQYVNPDDVRPYWDIASRWGLADEMFQTQGSGSFTAHQALIRGGTFINKTESLIDDPTSGEAWGCLSPKGATTSLIDTNLDYYRDQGPFPCTADFPFPNKYPTLATLLNAKSVSWKYYTPSPITGEHLVGALWNAFLVIAAVCNAKGQCTPHISSPETNIFSDISNRALPAMSWVIPDAENSDHPGFSAEDNGPSWVASVVNAIGESKYWDSTVIIVVWDDWGGFYDPVKPPFVDNQGGAGFRVPMLVISPYVLVGSGSQGGYISNTVYGFGSIIRFIEGTFRVGRLGTTDITTKSISDMFNFKQSPRPFKEIPSEHNQEFFVRQKPSGQAVDTE